MIQPKSIKPRTNAHRYILAGREFPSKQTLQTYLHSVLYAYDFGVPLPERDEALLLELLAMHPSAAAKIGVGVERIVIDRNQVFPQERSFWITRRDGTRTDFSYHKCLRTATPLEAFSHACRFAVQGQIVGFKIRHFAGHATVPCPHLDTDCSWHDVHVDHRPPLTFAKLVHDFIVRRSVDVQSVVYAKDDGMIGSRLADAVLSAYWEDFHAMYADLEVMSKAAHIALTRKRLTQPLALTLAEVPPTEDEGEMAFDAEVPF